MFNGRLTAYQLRVCTVVAIGSFCYGYSVNVTASTLGQPAFKSYMGLNGSPHATAITSAIGVGAYVGAAIACALTPFGADTMGRRFNLWAAGVLLVIVGAIQAGSANPAMFIASRVLVGFACGTLFTAVPVYQSEVAPVHFRGALIACHGTLFTMGSSSGQWMNVGFYFTSGAVSWRVPLALQCVFPLILLMILYWVPESPRYLVSKGRHEEAREILFRLHSNGDEDSQWVVEKEYQAIANKEASEAVANTKWSDLIATAANRKRTFIACFTAFLYAMTGVNAISNYSTSLYQGLGLGSVQQLCLVAALLTTAPIGNIASAFWVDRMGRKNGVLCTLYGCIPFLIIEMIVVLKGKGTTAGQIIGVLALFGHHIWFCAFYDVVCWCYTTEIWPQHLRAKGFSISLFFFFFGNILTVGVAPTAFAALSGYFYLIFVGFMAFSLILVHLYWPETKNLSLEDMGILFGDEPVEVVSVVTVGGEKSGNDLKLV